MGGGSAKTEMGQWNSFVYFKIVWISGSTVHPTSDTNFKFRDFSKPPSVPIPWMNSHNSLKAVMLIVMVYFRERTSININKEKRHVKQSPTESQMCPFPVESWGILNPHGSNT